MGDPREDDHLLFRTYLLGEKKRQEQSAPPLRGCCRQRCSSESVVRKRLQRNAPPLSRLPPDSRIREEAARKAAREAAQEKAAAERASGIVILGKTPSC